MLFRAFWRRSEKPTVFAAKIRTSIKTTLLNTLYIYFLYKIIFVINTATFNSGHDKKSGVWHPFLMAIHGFPLHILVGFCSVNILTKFHTCRCNTFKDIAPLITKPYRVLVGIPSLSQIPTKTLQGFFPYREKIPYREIKSLLLIQCREKFPVGNDSLYF